jgi:hypothetical protein
LDSNLPNPPAIFHRADTPAPSNPRAAMPVTGSTIGAALLCLKAMELPALSRQRFGDYQVEIADRFQVLVAVQT